MKRFLKITAVAVGAVICLVLILFLILQTGWVRGIIKQKVEAAANSALNAQVSLGELQGSLLWDVTLKDVGLRDKNGQIADIKRIFVGYDPFALLRGTILISGIIIENGEVSLRRSPDGNWNVANIVKPSEGPQPQPETKSKFGMKLEVLSAEIRNVHIKIHDESHPETGPVAVALAFKGGLINGSAIVKNLSLETEKSHINLAGHAPILRDRGNLDVTLNIPSFSLADAASILNMELPHQMVQGKVNVTGTVTKPKAEFHFGASDGQVVEGTMTADTAEPLKAALNVNVEKVDLEKWLPPTKGLVNGKIVANIQGSEPEKMKGEVKITLTGSSLLEQKVDHADITASISPGMQVQAKADIAAPQGDIDLSLNGALAGVLDDAKKVDGSLSLVMNKVDLTEFQFTQLPVKVEHAKITGNFVKEEREPLSKTRINADISFGKTSAWNVDVENAAVKGMFQYPEFAADKAEFILKDGRLSLAGKGELDGKIDATVKIDAKNVAGFTRPFLEEPFQGSLKGTLHATGELTSPAVDGKLTGANLDGMGMKVASFTLSLDGETSTLSTKADLNAEGVTFQDVSIPKLALKGRASPKEASVKADAKVEPDGVLNVSAAMTGLDEPVKKLKISELQAGRFNYIWKTAGPASVTLHPDRIDVESFTLVQDDQKLSVDGVVSFAGKNDFNLVVKNLSLEKTLNMAGVEDAPQGILDTTLHLKGTAQAPLIKASVLLKNLNWKEHQLDSVKTDIDYADKSASVTGLIQAPDGNKLNFDGRVPINLAMNVEGPRIAKKGLNFTVKGDNVNLAFLTGLAPMLTTVKATTDLNVTLTGNPFDPKYDGSISLRGDEIVLKQYDESIRDIKADVAFNNEQVTVKDMNLRLGDKGRVSLKGSVRLEGFKPTTLDVNLTTKNAPLPLGEELDASVSTDLSAQGSLESLNVKGDFAFTEKTYKLEWKSVQPISVEIKREEANIQSFHLSDGKQSIAISGNLSRTGPSDLTMEAKNLDIGKNLVLAGIQAAPEGVLNATVKLTGMPENPVITANVDAPDLKRGEFGPVHLSMKLNYEDLKASIESSLKTDKGDELKIQGVVPINLAFTDVQDRIPEQGMDVSLKGSNVDLSFLPAFVPQISEVKASLNVDVSVRGNPLQPDMSGSISAQGEKIVLKMLDDPIQNLDLKTSLSNEKVEITKLSATIGNQGKISASGYAALKNLKPENIELTLTMKDAPIDYKNIANTVASANITVKGPFDGISVQGDVTIGKGTVHLQNITTGIHQDVIVVETEAEAKALMETGSAPQSDVYRNMSMNVTVKAPGNLWVKGEGANVEIEIDLSLTKQPGEDVRINGTVTTVRGSYQIAGKVFNINEGTVTFLSLPEPNPNLDINATYNVGTVKIYLKVGGTAKAPTMTWTSDPTMDQSDIMSYLAFGSPVSGLSGSQSNSLQSTAMNFLGGKVLDSLKGVLGSKLALDMVQFQGGQSGTEGGTLVLGKYITPRIFVTYKSTIAGEPGNELDVQYEISDHFKLESQIGDQQNTGADIIIHFDY